MKLYKISGPRGKPVHGGTGAWPLPTDDGPGEWRTVEGPLVPCRNGLHLMRAGDLRTWVCEGVLWEAEVKPRCEVIDHSDKIVVRSARLVRRVAAIDRRLRVTWAADCAEHVLPVWETRYPRDPRPRQAIEAARGWVAATTSIEDTRAAADAAYAAAADAAAYTAAAAAAAAERDWQSRRLAELLGIEEGEDR